MWTDTLGSVTDLLGAVAAFLVALAGIGFGIRKVTGGKPAEAAVESGAKVPAAFDYETEWRYERKRNDRLVERADRLEARVTGFEEEVQRLRSYILKLEAALARNDIPF